MAAMAEAMAAPGDGDGDGSEMAADGGGAR
jgi:hypothetical protein